MLRTGLVRRLTALARQNIHNANQQYSVNRPDTHSVACMDPVQVIKDVELDYRVYRRTNYETKIRLNRFLQALFTNDITLSTEILHKFRNKVIKREVGGIEIYLSCMSTLLTYAANKETPTMTGPALQAIMMQLTEIPLSVIAEKPTEVNSLYLMLVSVFLRTLKETPPNRKRNVLLILEKIKQFLKTTKLDSLKIYDHLKTQSPDLIPQFNSVWKTNMPLMNEESVLFARINKYRNEDNLMSFTGICDFLTNELLDFSQFSLSRDKKYYEVYESLKNEDKVKFLKQLTSFSKKKQMAIEAHCHNLRINSRSIVPGMLSSVVISWTNTIEARMIKELEIILLGNAPNTALSQAILKHSFLFNHLSKETLVSVVLKTLICETTRGGEMETVRKLTQKMEYWLTRTVASRKELKLLHDQNWILHKEDSIGLFAALLKMACESSEAGKELVPFADESFKKHPNRLFLFDYESDERKSKYKKSGVIKAHPYLQMQAAAAKEVFETGLHLFPMLCPPKPWTSPKTGGFLNDMAPLVRSEDPEITYKYLSQAHLTGQLNSTYESINALGKVPWRVDSEMVDVLNRAMAISEGFLNIPQELKWIENDCGPRPKKSDFDNLQEFILARGKYNTNKQNIEKHASNIRSQRIFYNMTATLATALSKHGDMVYYPVTLDFRGRLYPAVSLLSYQGEDLVRSLLGFWEGKLLGKNGFKWLKYQLANLYSKNFMTIEDLEAFVDDNKDNIIASAQHPFEEKWWTKGDHPWQSLQLSKEITRIWEFKGNIEEWISHIPIHMDGTCNGLQHYAALGANTEAARSVNLVPSETKNDVYLAVLKIVKQKIDEDCVSTDPKTLGLAMESKEFLSRKLIKQTVMTTVYGVTRFGAFRQINEKLVAAVDAKSSSISRDRVTELLLYIAKNVLNSVSELFSGARHIQQFLMSNTFRCISSFDKRLLDHYKSVDFFDTKRQKPMMWTSLSGFPIIQSYRKNTSQPISTPLQTLLMRRLTLKSSIDVRKQMNAVAPNFIHSLDAIHMMMTNLAAQSREISFAAVHDSFWTHPCDIEELSNIIREQFVRLHSSDVLLNLYKDIEHTSCNDLQLVWIENSKNGELLERLDILRPNRQIKESTKDWLNRCLNEELKDNTQVMQLVEQYDPQLFLQTKSTGEGIIYDNNYEQVVHTKRLRITTHTPLLVNMRLAQVPPIGDLDINMVLDSKFFFS